MAGGERIDDSVAHHLQRIEQELQAFRARFAINFIVSISGGAEDHNVAYALNVVTELVVGLKNRGCAVLTGGTQGGIPELGTTIAKAHGIPTIAVYPPKAAKYLLANAIDLPIETLPPSIGPASFGSETPTFAQLPDYAVFIGGSYGTLVEVSTMMKFNTKRRRDNKEPIYIVPIIGSQGVADLIPSFALLNPNLAYCLPHFQILTGQQAADFITQKQASK